MGKEQKYYQNIILKFSDGKEIMASVPAFLSSEEEAENLSVVSVQISEPKELPEGVDFSYEQ